MAEKASKEKTVANFYAELNRQGQNGQYDRALKTANKIIGISPHDTVAFQCKIVCLIQLNKFEEAVQLILKKKEFAPDVVFERAYAYYRLNRHQEALEIITQGTSSDRRLLELKAQILYRLEQYKEVVATYRTILKNLQDDYEDERYTNLTAAVVYDSSIDFDPSDILENTYEVSYNVACIHISNGNYTEAEKTLKMCEKTCRENLEEEEISDEDMDSELALFRIQLGYVYQKQGRIKEAYQLYTSNLKLKLEDIALAAVASNNIVCMNKDQNLFDSKKKMKVATNEQLINKLPSKQRKYIAFNNAILNYYINQISQCEKICETINKTWTELALDTTILRACILNSDNKTEEALKLLNGFDPKSKEDKLLQKMALAHLLLMQGDRLEACKVLEDMDEFSYKPAIIGALTTLSLALGLEDMALKIFERSVEWYKKAKAKGDLTKMWRQAAEFHLRSGHPQVAANSLEELYRNNKNDKKILAQLILAYLQFDKNRTLELGKSLPAVTDLYKDVNLELLQSSTNILVNGKKSPAVKQDSLPSTPMEPTKPKQKKHKKRKGKLPKNYNPNVDPDPERWLPRYERAGYRKKRDRRVKDVIKGSQGTSGNQSQTEQYDFSKVSQEVSDAGDSSSITPSPRVAAKKPQKKKNRRR